jgi:YesN/AraC family two-component response regulator
LRKYYRGQGNELVCSTDGLDGYQKPSSYPYDLIILDVPMPEVLGTKIAEALKQKKPGAKVILISGLRRSVIARSRFKLGVPLLSKHFSR